MFKTKLFASICAAASAVTVAATALTLSIAGPSGVQSIHTLSANDAIASSIAGVFRSASDTADEVTSFVDTITSNKTATTIGFTINSLEGNEELSGLGGSLELQLDTENEAAAIILEATLGSVEVIDGTIYVDKNEIIAAAPALFEGVLQASLTNLEEDLTNSPIGQYILGDTDIEEIKEAFALFMEEYETYAPQFDFNSERFMEGLTDTVNKAFDEAMENMVADDLGKLKLNGGSYQCYDAKLPVKELSYILRDAIVYCLESEDFQDLVDQFIEYFAEMYGEDASSLGFSGSMLGQYSSTVKSYWGMIASSMEAIFGEYIEMTIYITDTVELAGFAMDICVIGDSVTYDKADAEYADVSMSIMADYTGGKNIGDYTDVSVVVTEGNDSVIFEYVQKYETNGDFDIDLTASGAGETFLIEADGNYVVDGEFFNLIVDSFKFTENSSTIFDIGFSIGFKPIDAIAKPSGTPVYNIWEMEEADFEELLNEIEEKMEDLVG